MPKHLLDIKGERTIIRETVDRIRPLVPPERTLIVTGRSHAAELIRQLPEIPAENILIEPVGRNTAPCIGLAALHIQKRVPDAVMLVLPSDHRIGDENAFRRVMAAAGRAASRGDALITIGIRPTGPETGYGYIEQGNLFATGEGEKIYRVRSIREKPPLEQAREFLRQGRFLWNSGMFVWKASTILKAIDRFLPELHEGLLQIREALGTEREEEIVGEVYSAQKAVSIDYGVMEKAHHVACVKGEFSWDDVGSWHAMERLALADIQGNIIQGDVVTLDTQGSTLISDHGLVAALGIRDLIVVRTQDATLVANKQDAQRVREIVQALDLNKRYKKYV